MNYKPRVVTYSLSFLTATAALIGTGGPSQAQEKKPNIILIVSDDFGYGDAGVYGGWRGKRDANAESRPDSRRGANVFRLLRPAELHTGPGGDTDWPPPQSKRHDRRGFTRSRRWPAGGGSFLCTDQYCTRYIMGTRGKRDIDTGDNNVGFRCVVSPSN